MTLSVFPYLLSYQQLAPVLIRLTLGGILIFWAYKGIRRTSSDTTKKALDVVNGLVGVLLVIGLWTQVAALIAAVGFVVCLVGKIRSKAFLTDGVNYMLILLILSLCLVVIGPGWWAFDYTNL